MKVISWEEYITGNREQGSGIGAITIGVFDGVHLGHQALIKYICSSPYVPTVVTFSQNPAQVLRKQDNNFYKNIFSLEYKLDVFKTLGVQLIVLIDFSEKFSKIKGGDFIKLLLKGNFVKMIALGEDFRCGHKLDTGAKEISSLAAAQGVKTLVLPPVMDEGHPVSSSRIRQAIASGRIAEAERLLGRSIKLI